MNTSKKSNIAGKKPIESKKIGPSFEDVDLTGSALQVPQNLTKQLNHLGFEIRFINAKRFSDSGNSHKSGWKPLKRSDFKDETGNDLLNLDQYLWGNDPDGTIRRHELVLAIRPTSLSDQYRAQVRRRTDIQAGGVLKQAADEMKQIGRRSGIEINVDAAYEDEQ